MTVRNTTSRIISVSGYEIDPLRMFIGYPPGSPGLPGYLQPSTLHIYPGQTVTLSQTQQWLWSSAKRATVVQAYLTDGSLVEG